MTTWAEFDALQPELAARGRALLLLAAQEEGGLEGGLGYLATVRPDGGPRVHPISPALHNGRLHAFILLASPKRSDLHRDGRFALHSWPHPFEAAGWSDEEWYAEGTARPIADGAVVAAVAAAVGDDPASGEVFELDLARVLHKSRAGGRVVYRRWPSIGPDDGAR